MILDGRNFVPRHGVQKIKPEILAFLEEILKTPLQEPRMNPDNPYAFKTIYTLTKKSQSGKDKTIVFVVRGGQVSVSGADADEMGALDIKAGTYLLIQGRRFWIECIMQGYELTHTVKKPLGKVLENSYTTYKKQCDMSDMELMEARINPKDFYKQWNEKNLKNYALEA